MRKTIAMLMHFHFFEQAVKQYPTSAEAWILLSNTRSTLRNFNKADYAANQALKLAP